jgi:hypothetical protein
MSTTGSRAMDIPAWPFGACLDTVRWPGPRPQHALYDQTAQTKHRRVRSRVGLDSSSVTAIQVKLRPIRSRRIAANQSRGAPPWTTAKERPSGGAGARPSRGTTASSRSRPWTPSQASGAAHRSLPRPDLFATGTGPRRARLDRSGSGSRGSQQSVDAPLSGQPAFASAM